MRLLTIFSAQLIMRLNIFTSDEDAAAASGRSTPLAISQAMGQSRPGNTVVPVMITALNYIKVVKKFRERVTSHSAFSFLSSDEAENRLSPVPSLAVPYHVLD